MKFGKQIAYANKIHARAVVFRGDEEIANNTFTIKWLGTGEQKTYTYSKEHIAAITWS